MNGRNRLLGCVLSILVLSGCSEATAPGSDRQDDVLTAPLELTLRMGEEKAVGGSVLRIAFGQVLEDSRCPVDAMCVWAGNAAVELGIRAGMGPTHPLRLSTTLEPRSTVWNGLRVTLLEVAPAPRAAEPTKPGAYSVRVRVETEGK
ncbi:MAG: hypothetical protein Q8N53_02865 [Longimicrobiales bacterium]|nr:hypothetical protein [Longimicrobiales bacterium]